jgi:poly(3-hydroxybutyrate) depolymerase
MRFTSIASFFLAATLSEVAAERSVGCGKAPLKIKNGNNLIESNGSRSFMVRLPPNYDPNHAYRVIFVVHATMGQARMTAASYDGMLSRAGNDSILVAPQGLVATTNGSDGPRPAGINALMSSAGSMLTGWWRTGGRYGEDDLNFIGKILDTLDEDLCVNTRQRFVTGFSFGGVMAYSLACKHPEKWRAVVCQSGASLDNVMAGMTEVSKRKGTAEPGGCKRPDPITAMLGGANIDALGIMDGMMLSGKPPAPKFECGTKPVAYMGIMGLCDGWVKYGREAKDDFIRNNGCKPKEAKRPKEGSGGKVTTVYDCPEEYPVIWSEFDGGHMPTINGADEAWNFFQRFR